MDKSQLNSCTTAYSLSFAVVSLLIGLLVVSKELNEGLLGLMKKLTVHHWVTHALFDLAVFFLLGLALSRLRKGQGPEISDENTLKLVIGGAVVGVGIVLVYYGIFD